MSTRRFRFGRQQEDGDSGSDFVAGTKERGRWWRWKCSWCSHMNPPKADECEQCGYEREDDE